MKEIMVEKSCEPPEIRVIDPKRPAPARAELTRAGADQGQAGQDNPKPVNNRYDPDGDHISAVGRHLHNDPGGTMRGGEADDVLRE